MNTGLIALFLFDWWMLATWALVFLVGGIAVGYTAL
jgi:hypothetical protein